MKPPPNEKALEMLLNGTPAHIADAWAGHDPQTLAELDALREIVADVGLSLAPVAPSPSLRERVLASITAAPSNARRAALVVMDMLNDHLTPGAPLEVPRARDIVPALRARIDQAHAAGEPVVYLCDHHEPGDPDLEGLPLHNVGVPREDIWPALAATDADEIVTHRAYSGFFQTELDAVLKRLDVNTVVMTGCITEMHLYITAADALQHGYKVEMPRDCQAGSSPVAEGMTMLLLSAMRPSTPLGG